MKFKTKLYNILDELNSFDNNEELFETSIKQRLNKALENYNEAINYSKHILSQKNPIMVMRRINRRMKDE